jgi:hypothetical protein
MSLINEALKKAQRQRSLDAAPLSAAPSGVAAAAVTTHVRAASHKRSHGPLWFGLGLVALGAAAAGLVMHYGVDSSPTPTQTAPVKSIAVAPTPVAAPPQSAPVARPSAAAESSPSAPMVVLPTIPAIKPVEPATPPRSAAPTPATRAEATPSIAPSTTPTTSSTAVSVAPVDVGSAITESPAPTATPSAPAPVVPVAAVLTPAEREAKIYEFLTNLRLTGVRGLDRDARVLMNERVWRLNDIVSPELGLRLSAIRPNLLVFTDSQGKTFEKPY